MKIIKIYTMSLSEKKGIIRYIKNLLTTLRILSNVFLINDFCKKKYGNFVWYSLNISCIILQIYLDIKI